MRGDGTYRGMGAAMLIVAVVIFYPGPAIAAAASAGQDWMGLAYISAALAVGLSCIGSAYAVARIGSAGMGAISEKPELTGRVLVFVGLAEGIAIYGLIIAIMILNKL